MELVSRRHGSFPSDTRPFDIPFDVSQQLCKKLEYDTIKGTLSRSPSRRDIEKDWLPGDPYIRLHDPQIAGLLHKEYSTPKLDSFARHLWLVGRPDSAHIASLTHQVVRGRRIVLTDDPELHLVWYHDRVFVKPLPNYLLSHPFWEHCCRSSTFSHSDKAQTGPICRALAGFIRTYTYLIRHKSDFELATHSDHRLINKDIRFSDLIRLLETVGHRVSDEDVSPRWRYGELRLSRLNLWSRIVLKHHNFATVHGQYSEYVAQFYAPLLFVFAVLSVMLNAMQVGTSINKSTAGEKYVEILGRISKVFVPLSLLIVAVAVVWFLATIATTLMRVIILGLRTQAQRRLRYRRSS